MMAKLILLFKKTELGIILILLASTIVRLVPLDKLMVFTPDESYILYIVQTLVKDFHIIWIGVNALGFDFYMGPFWMYFLYPFVAIFRNEPIVVGIISSLIGVITVWVIYWFGKKLYNKNVGLLASLFYGISSLTVFYDQQPYPSAVPLLSLLMAISFYMTRESKKWLYLFALSYGLVFHLHLSLVLLIFAGIYWVLSHKFLDKKTFFVSTIIFLITISPLIAFDYFHKGSNITAPLRVIEAIGKNGSKTNINKKFNSVTQALSRVWYLDSKKSNIDEILYPCNTSPEAKTTKAKLPLVVLSLIILTAFFVKNDLWRNDKKKLLFLFSLCFIIPYLTISSINSVEYYLLGFFPIFFIISAKVLSSVKKPLSYIIFALIALFVIYNIYTVLVANGDYGLKTKRIIIAKVMEVVGNNPYELSEEGGLCQGAAGWRYLYKSYARIPVKSSEDRSFAWLWPDEVSKEKPKYLVVMEDRRVPKQKNEGYKKKITEGGFNAYIY